MKESLSQNTSVKAKLRWLDAYLGGCYLEEIDRTLVDRIKFDRAKIDRHAHLAPEALQHAASRLDGVAGCVKATDKEQGPGA